jgi:phosphoglycolate phosphatase
MNEQEFSPTAAETRRFDCVVFDWDGTIMDSIVAIADSIQKAARDLGLPEPSFQQASSVIGLGLIDALSQAIPQASAEQMSRVSERYRHHYLSRDADLMLFPRIASLLQELRGLGLTLCVATGKSRAGLNRALTHPELRGLFHATRCADEGHPKPHPWMLLDLSDELGIEPARMLMIGDTVHDRELAKRAGASFVGVAYGAHPADQLGAVDCLACVNSVEALRTQLLNCIFLNNLASSERSNDLHWVDVCSATDLWEGGLGHRFDIPVLNETGFVVRSQGEAHAYVNRCAHVAIELDWQPGQFFDDQAEYLVCSTHGALYEADTGTCIGGPCRGQRLIKLEVREHNGRVQVNLESVSLKQL